MLGEVRYKNENKDEIFLAHYYDYDLYYDPKTKMVAVMNADHTGTKSATWMVKNVNKNDKSFYPLNVARNIALRFKMFTKEEEEKRQTKIC